MRRRRTIPPALLASALALIGVVTAAGAARAEGCLEPQTTFVVLNFVAPESDDARIIERVIQDDRRGWIVRRCDDLKLLGRITHGDKVQLEQLVNRRIILAIYQEGTTIRHHVIPYAWKRVSTGHDPPAPASFGMCQPTTFEFEDACKRYAGPARALLATAVALYKLTFSSCAELEDANATLNEALNGLAKIGDAASREDLRDFVLSQRDELRAKVEALRCGPRALNARLIKDRQDAGSPSMLIPGVWNPKKTP